MDTTNNTTAEYFSELPEVVQDAILSPEWKKRFSEIITKYSLTPLQSSDLHAEVLCVVMEIDAESDLSEKIKNELSVSEVLATQLSEEINIRLLSWLDKMYKTSDENQNLPAIEQNETAHDIPHFSVPETPLTPPTPKNPPQVSVPRYVPQSAPVPPPPATVVSKPHNLPGVEIVEDKYAVDPYREPLN